MNGGVGYAYDDSLREAANAAGRNYWPCYTREICETLGVCASPVGPDDIGKTASTGSGLRVLMLGDGGAERFPEGTVESLARWGEGGGILIGMGTRGMDALFGVTPAGAPDVTADPFEIAGWMSLDGRDEASGLLDSELPETLCPVMAPFRRIACNDAVCLTEIGLADASAGGAPESLYDATPAVTCRKIGTGRAYYFAFNLAQAVWTYHRGRPVTEDVDGDGVLRVGDAILVPPGPAAATPCADVLLLIIENILAGAGVPFIHQLPPQEGGIPDALFYYAGDDEAADGLQAKMSDLMASFGLAYHINVMLGKDGRHHFTDKDVAVYERYGHEVSLHFNFINYPKGVEHPAPISPEEYDRQYGLYLARFGTAPVCVNNHWCRTSGWADTARMGARHGVKGEHHRVHHPSPPLDPVNLFGAVFGTVFPHFVYDDAAHGNERLEFVDVPITFYEPGAVSCEESHPYFGQDPFRPDEYRRIVRVACRQGWTLNLFLHPTHMFKEGGRGRDALREMLDEIERLGARVIHAGSDALCLWWHARARSSVDVEDAGARYTVRADHEDGLIVRFMAAALPNAPEFRLDGRTIVPALRERRGAVWHHVVVPKGAHTLSIE